MPRRQPQNARESREYLRDHYAREAASRHHQADLAGASGLKNTEENLRNLAERSNTYSHTAARMLGGGDRFDFGLHDDSPDGGIRVINRPGRASRRMKGDT